jgi:hypothetical protein
VGRRRKRRRRNRHLIAWKHQPHRAIILFEMKSIEFITELSGATVLNIPKEVAAQLPKSGKARILVLTEEDAGDALWRQASYEQFLRDDSPEDAVYDSLE